MNGPAIPTKELLIRAIQELPDDVEFDAAMDRLLLLHKIQRGVDQADKGQLISNEEAKTRMEKWRT